MEITKSSRSVQRPVALNLGCGRDRTLRFGAPCVSVIHADIDLAVKPDIKMDAEVLWPFADDAFDAVHMYHIIEHIGHMGDTNVWFRFWSECWRVCMPDAVVYVVAPHYLNECAIGDPGHTRLISQNTFYFLGQRYYKAPKMTQYKIPFDFEVMHVETTLCASEPDEIICFLRAIKNNEDEKV